MIGQIINAQDLTGTFNMSISANIALGSQLKGVNFEASIFGTSSFNSFSVEGGINVNLTPFIQKIGIYQTNIAGNLELFALLGYGKNNHLLGANVGLEKHNQLYDFEQKESFFYGMGISVLINKIKGSLSKFDNIQNGVIFRFASSKNSFTLNFTNDSSGFPFAKTGSDKGSTARVLINFVTIQMKELYGFGLGMNMFTPEADYTRMPSNPINSDDHIRAVYYNTKPYDDLFHLNLFLNFQYQKKDNFGFIGKIGVDSPKVGALFQNKLHDSFGLFSRFSWPIDRPNKVYSLFEINKPYNYTP